MVFKKPDLRGLKIWKPLLQGWNQRIAIWIRIPFSGVSDTFPDDYRDADVFQDPISLWPADASRKKRKNPDRSDPEKLVAVKL